MKNYFLLVMLFFSSISIFAQDLHVYYDVYRDSTYYLKDNKPVRNANLKKGQYAILHIVNYNDYIYKVDVKTQSKNYEIPSTGGGQLFNLKGMGDAFDQLKSAAGNFSTEGFQLGKNSMTDKNLGAAEYDNTASLEAIKLSKSFKTKLEALQLKEQSIQYLAIDIKEGISNQQSSTFKRQQIRKLRTNPNLSARKIKEISLAYMEQVLGVTPGREYSLNDLLKNEDPNQSIKALVEEYKEKTEALDDDFTELAVIAELLFAYKLDPTDQTTFKTAFETAQHRKETYVKTAKDMDDQLDKLATIDRNELAEINYLYLEMKDHRFEKTITLRPEDDLTSVQISLVPIDSVKVEGVSTQELAPLEIEVFGGLKINASVGISFAGFFNRPQDFGVRDGRIFADDLDAFVPVITSFIHFHPQSKRQVSLGGAFGLGIGLGGEGNGLQNYFLGPSLIVGKRQRIVFSTGLMTGKVNRLARAYQVGDAFDETDVPTKSIYELGYFLGVSFNFLGK